jgi:hypothetical protein
VQLYRYFANQSSGFCRHDPLCYFSTSVYCCKRVFCWLSPETFAYNLVFTIAFARDAVYATVICTALFRLVFVGFSWPQCFFVSRICFLHFSSFLIFPDVWTTAAVLLAVVSSSYFHLCIQLLFCFPALDHSPLWNVKLGKSCPVWDGFLCALVLMLWLLFCILCWTLFIVWGIYDIHDVSGFGSNPSFNFVP